jgi:predicted metal-dependent hydrolase
MEKLTINGLQVDVTRKRIKNLHLRVCPPHGEVRVTIPLFIRDAAVHSLVTSRFEWIKRQQLKFRDYVPPPPMEMVSGEVHYFSGKPHLLNVIPTRGAGRVGLRHSGTDEGPVLDLYSRESSSSSYRKKILQAWYREQLFIIVPPLLEKWQKTLGVQVTDWGVKKMKSKWGSCHTRRKHIWLNLDLMKTAPECLEYVVLHELVHLLEPSHNKRFKSFMDNFMPDWRLHKAELNKTTPCK